MDPAAIIVPAIASVALGGALLVPIRDGRSGRKATLLGRTPLTADFRSIAASQDVLPDDAAPANASSSQRIAPFALDDTSPCESFERVFSPEAETGKAVRANGADAKEMSIAAEEFAGILAAVEAASANPNDASDRGLENVARARDRSKKAAIASDLARAFRAMHRRLLARSKTRAVSAVDAAVERENTVERSFADTIASLFPSSHAEAALSTRAPEAKSSPLIHPIDDRPFASGRATPRAPSVHDSVSSRSGVERAVPLTRLPHRLAAKGISWPEFATPALVFATEFERYAYLRSCAVDAVPGGDALLARAFREETAEGRSLALAAFSRTNASVEAIDTFVAALARGTDEERSNAIDALADCGSTAELTRGLNDRIDAIAAKAALAYVGSSNRDDYRVALAPFLEPARIDAILAMLAGVVE